MLVITPGATGTAAARVLGHVRGGGVMRREGLAAATGLSPATVSRGVNTLIRHHLIQARADMARAGAIGRPSLPVEIERSRYGVIGAHIGRLSTVVGFADLTGRIRHTHHSNTPPTLTQVIDDLIAAVDQLTADETGRTPLVLGVVAPWRDLDHEPESLIRAISGPIGLPLVVADHISAIAAAEHTAGLQGVRGETAYVYARDTIGFALAHDVDQRTVVSRASRLTHFPTGSRQICHCRRTGCLEATASDAALGRRAHAAGLTPTPEADALYEAAKNAGSAAAHRLLMERAAVLGRAAAFVQDMISPDQLVLVGPGFTRYDPARRRLLESFDNAVSVGGTSVRFGQYGAELQAVAASAIALGPVYEDPISIVTGRARQEAP